MTNHPVPFTNKQHVANISPRPVNMTDNESVFHNTLLSFAFTLFRPHVYDPTMTETGILGLPASPSPEACSPRLSVVMDGSDDTLCGCTA